MEEIKKIQADIRAILHMPCKEGNGTGCIYEAMTRVLPHSHAEGIEAATAICLLYIAHAKNGFPLARLRTINYNLRQEVALPIFDCRYYDNIIAYISGGLPMTLMLPDATCTPTSTTVCADDLKEAFDFYTNT